MDLDTHPQDAAWRDAYTGGTRFARKRAATDISFAVEEVRERNKDWDAFVAAQAGGDIVQSTAWGLSKRANGKTTLLLTARRRGDLAGGALLIETKVGPGLRLAYVSRGPVLAEAAGDFLPEFLAALVRCARSRHVHALIVQMPRSNQAEDAMLDKAGFSPGCVAVAPEATIRVDITQPEDIVLARMSTMRRRNLRKPVDAALEITESDDLPAFHRLHCATARRSDFPPLSLNYLQAQWQALEPSGYAGLLLARYCGRPVAGVWLSLFGGVATFRLAGWDADAGAPRNVNERLHWEAMRWARAHAAHSYDFGGFDRISAELFLRGEALPAGFEGSHNFFKLGFGGTPVLLPTARYRLLNRVAHFAIQPVLPLVLKSPIVKRMAQKLRA